LQINNKGSCTPKHLYLGQAISSFGLNVKYNASLFLWKDIPLDYPRLMKNIVNDLSPTIHLSLKVDLDYSKDSEIFLDASWDLGLKNIGLTINDLVISEYGIIKSTSNAVVPLEEKTFNNSYDYLNYVNTMRNKDEKKKHFYYELNEWFKSVREKNGKTMG
jgi:hypothetical protein